MLKLHPFPSLERATNNPGKENLWTQIRYKGVGAKNILAPWGKSSPIVH